MGESSWYSVSLVATTARDGERVVGCDNERGKGSHRHVRGRECRYRFVSVEELMAVFLAEFERERNAS